MSCGRSADDGPIGFELVKVCGIAHIAFAVRPALAFELGDGSQAHFNRP